MKQLVSVVIPCYNEAANVEPFYGQLHKIIDQDKKHDFELIYVNDGSSDQTLVELKKIASKHPFIRVVNLSRNFGKEIATTAGISYTKGDAVIMIDGDGQHPPELIPQLIKKWEDGYQVVIGVRVKNKKEGLVKKLGSKLFYRIFNVTSNAPLIPGATDYRLFDKAVRDEFLNFTERYRITRGLIDWIGFKRTTVPFNANARLHGQAGYKVSKLFGLALNSFVSLSMAPLYAIGYVGIVITLCAFMVGAFIFFEQLVFSDPLHLKVTGTAMIGLLILFLVGVIMIAQGLLALYLSHIHIQTQNRPLFIVDKKNSTNL